MTEHEGGQRIESVSSGPPDPMEAARQCLIDAHTIRFSARPPLMTALAGHLEWALEQLRTQAETERLRHEADLDAGRRWNDQVDPFAAAQRLTAEVDQAYAGSVPPDPSWRLEVVGRLRRALGWTLGRLQIVEQRHALLLKAELEGQVPGTDLSYRSSPGEAYDTVARVARLLRQESEARARGAPAGLPGATAGLLAELAMQLEGVAPNLLRRMPGERLVPPAQTAVADFYRRLFEHLEAAWGVIANAGGWTEPAVASPGWRGAAERWRDLYHALVQEAHRLAIDTPLAPAADQSEAPASALPPLLQGLIDHLQRILSQAQRDDSAERLTRQMEDARRRAQHADQRAIQAERRRSDEVVRGASAQAKQQETITVLNAMLDNRPALPGRDFLEKWMEDYGRGFVTVQHLELDQQAPPTADVVTEVSTTGGVMAVAVHVAWGALAAALDHNLQQRQRAGYVALPGEVDGEAVVQAEEAVVRGMASGIDAMHIALSRPLDRAKWEGKRVRVRIQLVEDDR